MFLSILLMIAICYGLKVTSATVMSPTLSAHFVANNHAHVILVMKGEVGEVISSINSRSFRDSDEKTIVLRQQLHEFTQKSQKNVLSFLGRKASENNMVVKPFYITNRISIQNAPKEVVLELMRSHGDEIEEIRQPIVIQPYQPIVHEDDPDVHQFGKDGKVNVIPWSIQNINVPNAHKDGYMGQGVVVGIMDSGIKGDHEALQDKMRKTFNWFDAQNGTSEPFDIMGHGTHCLGTILGGNGIGISPKSEWMACRIFDDAGASEDVIYTCAQFIFCPTEGTKEDCSKRPHVCSNSWGGGQNEHFFNDAILAWRAANIIPVFAIGNDGPACRTANSPGDQPNLISVGASTAKNGLAFFSSRGPTANLFQSQIKPDISAPGYRIISAYISRSYASFSGTSMAAPHITGCIAVLLSKKPSATYSEIYEALVATAYHPSLTPNLNHQCFYEGVSNPNTPWPNNIFGHGIIRLDAALEYLKN